MKSLSVFSILISGFLLSGCNIPVGTTLLSSQKSCTTTSTATTDTDCTTDSTSTGATAIAPIDSSAVLSKNMDVSDTIEITGTCQDQGRKNNRILVQVFAGDLAEGVDPYIDNSTSNKCLNTASGIAAGEKCFSVTKGLGFTESSGQPDQRDFPNCHNGQFGFSVRLGRILTDTTLGLNYLIRFKLRTIDGTLVDTVWSRVTVSRGVTAPKINSVTPSQTLFSCTLNNSVARFDQNIQYSLQKTYTNAGVTSAAYAVAGFGTTSASPLAYNFTDLGLAQGTSYTYSVVATEGQYSSLYGGVPQTATSNAVTCAINAPAIYQTAAATSTSCTIGLSPGQVNAAAPTYDIGIAKYGGWATSGATPPDGFIGCSSGALSSGTYVCNIAGLTTGQTYYIAVRNRGALGEVGDWSNETPCKPL